jgi:hypothetical protein
MDALQHTPNVTLRQVEQPVAEAVLATGCRA